MLRIESKFLYVFSEHIELEIDSLSDFCSSEIGPVLSQRYERDRKHTRIDIDYSETHAIDSDTSLFYDERIIVNIIGNSKNKWPISLFFE